MYEITMPSGGQTTDESLICKWHKKPGDKIERGDVLFEIETDKTTLEVESFCAGYLRMVKYDEGESAATGEIVAYIGEMDEVLPEPVSKAQLAPKIPETKKIEKIEKNQHNRTLASPLAKKIAKDNGIELKNILSKSPSGIIKKQDVENHIEKLSKRESAALYRSFCIEADVSECVLFLNRLNAYLKDEHTTVEPSDMAIKCIALTLEKFPTLKPLFESDKIAQATNKSLAEIAKERERETEELDSEVVEIAMSIKGKLTSRDVMQITMYYNRREAKKATIERFLAEVQKLLESPELVTLAMAI